MRKTAALFLILNLLVLSLVGCSASKQPPAGDKKQKVTVLLDWVPNTNHTGLYVAKEKGFYNKAGLDVNIIQPSEGGTAQLTASGQGDFGISYQEEVTVARSQNIPIKALAAVIQHNTSGFASPVAKNIKTPRDFAGKTYGGWGSPAETAMIKALMNKYEADFNQVTMINTGTADFFTSIQKDVDFAWIFWGWAGIEAELKGIDLNFIKLRDEERSLDFYTPVIIASEEKIAQEPDLVRRFMKATAEGYQFAINNPDESAEILCKNVPELNRELIIKSMNYLAGEYQSDAQRWGEMKKAVWQNYADFMYENGLIEANINAEDAFTNEFLP